MLKRTAPVCAAVLVLSACSDGALVRPLDDSLPLQPPSFALVDAARGEGGAEGFYFLPPLAKNTTVEGDFDPNLLPSMQVCELTGNPSEFVNDEWEDVACTGGPVVSFPAGSAVVDGSSYQFSWKTGAPLDPDKFYRIQILLDDLVLGFLDVNPQQPSGQTPGEDYPDLYAFRLGETLPVKFFLSPQARCYGADGYVIQCTATAVVDQNGGTVSLEPEQPGWPRLSVVIPAGALPGIPQVTVTLERIHPDSFAATTGQECIPAFDAPQFSDCLRVTTDPELPAALLYPALIEMCIDPYAQGGLTEAQAERIQIIRFDDSFDDSGTGAIQGLPMQKAHSCPNFGDPNSTARGLLPVPEGGLLRLAALGVNGLARLLGPEALAATRGEIRLAGTTSNFSRFRWALPGEMVKVAGDNVVIQEPETSPADYTIPVTVQVVDTGGVAVAGARVRFSAGANPTYGISSDSGFVRTEWTVLPGAGTKTLTARALGLLNDKVPGNQNLIEFTEKTVTFTATVVGAPHSSTQTPTTTLTGAPGETLSTPLVITVLDKNGNPVRGWDVDWSTTCEAPGCTPGTLDGDKQTSSDGTASATWTLSSTAGGNTATATVGDITATWYANGICQVVVDGVMTASEWACGGMESFTANISGGSTPAEVYWQNDGTNLYMAVRVRQSSLSRVSSLRVDFDNDGSGLHKAGSDAIGYDAGTMAFFDHYLTQRCANNGQSGCGEADKVSTDGAGAVGNDGTWTVYELSHPLTGTPGEDFIRSAEERLGFFLTLRIGNGAQGNTQWPGFRVFRFITIQ